MKMAPMAPVIDPSTIAEGRFDMGDLSCVTLPNLSTEAEESVTSDPSYRLVRMANVKVLIADAKKVNQSMLNVQKVVGLEIS